MLHVHARDAAARGIADGDQVRVFNDRGSCLLRAEVDDIGRAGRGLRALRALGQEGARTATT